MSTSSKPTNAAPADATLNKSITYHLEKRDLRVGLSDYQWLMCKTPRGMAANFLPIIVFFTIMAIIFRNELSLMPSAQLRDILIMSGLLFITGVILILILQIWVVPFFSGKRQYETNAMLRGEQILQWNDKKVTIKGNNGTSTIEWHTFYRLHETKNNFFLLFGHRSIFFVPKRFLGSAQIADLHRIVGLYNKR